MQSAPSITQHLLANPPSTSDYNPNIFTLLDTSSSKLQLLVLKVLYITKYQLALCKQKEFYILPLFNPIDYSGTKPDLVVEKIK